MAWVDYDDDLSWIHKGVWQLKVVANLVSFSVRERELFES